MKAGLAVDAEGELALGAPPHAALPLHDHGTLADDPRAQHNVGHGLQRRLQLLPLKRVKELGRYQRTDLEIQKC